MTRMWRLAILLYVCSIDSLIVVSFIAVCSLLRGGPCMSFR